MDTLARFLDCGYSMELPHRGGSNEYPHSLEQKQAYPCNPQFSVKTWVSKVSNGSKLHGPVSIKEYKFV